MSTPAVVEAASGAGVRQEGALAERDGDPGDRNNGEKGHLKAGFEEGAWRGDEDSKCGGSEGVEWVAVAGEKAGDEEDGCHQESTLDGDAEAGEEGVGGGEGQSDGRGERIRGGGVCA